MPNPDRMTFRNHRFSLAALFVLFLAPALLSAAEEEAILEPEEEKPAYFPQAEQFLGLLRYEPVYFSVGFNEVTNARFQLSLRVRPVGSTKGDIYDKTNFFGNFYFGYTQTSLWDLESESKPFYDTSYKPAVFYGHYGFRFLGAEASYTLGFEHESNGQSGDDSRSLNLAVFHPSFIWRNEQDWSFEVSPKLYLYLEKSENPDLPEYRGYGDYVFSVEKKNSLKLEATIRLGTSGKGSLLLDASYPMHEIFGPKARGYLHLQYFTGYTESLRSYNEKEPSQLRIGYMMIR